jgi:hypothetical protein
MKEAGTIYASVIYRVFTTLFEFVHVWYFLAVTDITEIMSTK